jgi:hypothetical protein
VSKLTFRQPRAGEPPLGDGIEAVVVAVEYQPKGK